MLLGMGLTVLFDSGKRSPETVSNRHYMQNTTHELMAVTIARYAIGEQSWVNVDAIQESDCRDLQEKEN
jgi:hypothetical protein